MKKNTHPKPTREQRRQRAREVRAQAKQDVRSHPLLSTTYVVLRCWCWCWKPSRVTTTMCSYAG